MQKGSEQPPVLAALFVNSRAVVDGGGTRLNSLHSRLSHPSGWSMSRGAPEAAAHRPPKILMQVKPAATLPGSIDVAAAGLFGAVPSSSRISFGASSGLPAAAAPSRE